MRFSLSVTTALLLQVSKTAEAASSSSSSSSSATFLDAFEFGRSPPIQRKRNLVIQTTDSTHRMAKTAKAEAGSTPTLTSDGSSDAKASKDGGYRLMPKSSKVLSMPKSSKLSKSAFSVDTVGSMFVEPRVAKADKPMVADMSYSFASLDFSMPTSALFFSMSDGSGDTTSTPTPSPPNGNDSDSGDDGSVSVSPTPYPTERFNDFHEVVFKYLSVCTGVELELDCLTSTTIEALMAQYGEAASRARDRRFLGIEATVSPTVVNTRDKPPSSAPSEVITVSPTKAPVTAPPTPAPSTPVPTDPPITATVIPTTSATWWSPTPSPTDKCRPEVNEPDLLSILTTSKQVCIDSGTNVSNETFQSTLSSFLEIFDEDNTCWDSLCEHSDATSDLFYQILFEQASECADVTLSVDDCIIDHIIDVVFSNDSEDGSRVRRSLQESCCDTPTESDLNFYAQYLLLSADAACTEQGNVEITTEAWNTATNELVKLFSATECWGVEPCEEGDDVVVGEEVSSADGNSAISGDTPPFYDGPLLSDDGEVCTITPGISDEDVRSLELSFYYQVETTSDSLDLGLIERTLIEKVCDDAGNERRLNELETEVVAVDASPDDVISEQYTCTSTTPGTTCQIIRGALTILLHGPITPNEETLLLAKIASLFPLTMGDEVVTYLATPTSSTQANTSNSTQNFSTKSAFGITAAATAVVTIALLTRGMISRRCTNDDSAGSFPTSKQEYKGQDELTIAGTAELTCASADPSPKCHVVNEEEREHWRELGMEGDV